MSVTIERIEKKESHRWNEFVRNHPYSTPYHLWEFGEALSTTYGYDKYYLVAKRNAKIVGLFPLILIRSRVFGSKLLSLPFCEYGGPLLIPNTNNPSSIATRLLSKALTIASGLNVDYIEVRSPALKRRLFTKNGYKPVSRYVTFNIPLSSSIEDMWHSLDKKTRNSIRKAMKADLDIYEVTDKRGLGKYFSLYLEVEKKYGSPSHSSRLFTNLLGLGENLKVLMADYKGTLVAGIITFHDKNGIYWWGGASDPRFRQFNAPSLLLWKVMSWGCENGYSFLSLGRTRRGPYGVYHFKKGWGGSETLYNDYVYSLKGENAITPDPSEGIYFFVSRIWSHLPISVSRLLGPMIARQIGL